MVQNLTNDSYTFAPDIIHADITKKNGTTETLRVYSNEAFQKKIKRQQAWASALYGLSAGLNAGMAGYQTSYVTTRSYNGYTYTQPVTTYNSTAAYQANMAATTQLMVLSKQMEQDKKIREEGYLKKTTIHSSEGIFGYMNVEREKGTVMRVALYGLSAGLNAGMAGYQTSYVTTRSYNGYTYTQPVTTYNSTAAYQANMAATTQLMVLSKQMEQDKKIREEGYLKKTTIHSSEGIFGYMNVEREKGTVMRVVIPVNGENYGFHWDVANKKK